MEVLTTADYFYDTTTSVPLATPTAYPTDSSLLDLSASITPSTRDVVERLLLSGSGTGSNAQQFTHNQITFEIPSHHDLEHINKLHTFNTLLQRIGNVAYDTVASSSTHDSSSRSTVASAEQAHRDSFLHPFGVDATGPHITSEQISKSAVLNLADLKANNGVGSVGGGFLESLFGDADMHMVINYLWIGVVTALVVLSVIFILFSCYFYRKFRQWKKCNKDIRNHMHNDLYADGHIVACDRLMDAHGQHPATAAGAAAAAAYYQQIESPPCYTIATGLPTYDEALHHHQHFAYGMKFVYPTLTAVHHHQHPTIGGGVYNSNCNNNNAAIATMMLKQQQIANDHWQQQQEQQLVKQKSYKVSQTGAKSVKSALADANELLVASAAEGLILQMDDVPTTYECDIAELHSLNLPAAEIGVAAPLLGVNAATNNTSTEKSSLLEEVITIRLDDMTPTVALAGTTPTQITRPTRTGPQTLYFNEQ
ncbi:uncharacterized protein comm [Eurosta solidaginis]|uniref:uncharacterized protein comm n=1 Tax=Eurosta solidaginis TaxID=178769 RepID=UPI0035308993